MKNKRVDYIGKLRSKRHAILPKTLQSFFQMREKLKTCWNVNLIISGQPSGDDMEIFNSNGDDINETFMR